MDDVRRHRHGGDPLPCRTAEPFFVKMQRVHRQSAEAARVLPPVHRVAHVRGSDDGRLRAFHRMPHASEHQRLTGNHVDLDAKRVELAHPGQMPRLASASHHRETAHEHRHAHARAPDCDRSTCWRAQSSRQTSAQMRLA
jgi:hypothetical protein